MNIFEEMTDTEWKYLSLLTPEEQDIALAEINAIIKRRWK